MVQTDQGRGDVEDRERAYQKELKELRAQLSELTHEKQLQSESALKAERLKKDIELELEEKDKTLRKLRDDVNILFLCQF